jgi:ubiquinone/menaquinone biosynthesis C-methylase UbiE
LSARLKDWDQHVVDAEEVARRPGFQALRERILELADLREDDVVVDVGAGTGLLALAAAPDVERVWAIDISPAMLEYLRVKAASGGHDNIEVATASAASLPLVDGTATVVVSNYCLHHLDEDGKRRALAEMFRVLRPGGRVAFGDMMFQVSFTDARDRQVIGDKVRAMTRMGPAGIARLARNGMRFARGAWEKPARAEWWDAALREAGFADVGVEVLHHEGGVAWACRP